MQCFILCGVFDGSAVLAWLDLLRCCSTEVPPQLRWDWLAVHRAQQLKWLASKLAPAEQRGHHTSDTHALTSFDHQ